MTNDQADLVTIGLRNKGFYASSTGVSVYVHTFKNRAINTAEVKTALSQIFDDEIEFSVKKSRFGCGCIVVK